MDILVLTTFIVTSVLLIIIPGPNVLIVVSTSISCGTKRGLQTVLGTSTAMSIQLLIAALGTTWFVGSVSAGFEWLRWLGVAWLVYAGVTYLLKVTRSEIPRSAPGAVSSFSRGFAVSLTNPKTIIFFSAFLPQFVTSMADYNAQIMILSVVFLLLATVLDGLYALLAGYCSGLLHRRDLYKTQNALSGVLYLGAGIWLALARKS